MVYCYFFANGVTEATFHTSHRGTEFYIINVTEEEIASIKRGAPEKTIFHQYESK